MTPGPLPLHLRGSAAPSRERKAEAADASGDPGGGPGWAEGPRGPFPGVAAPLWGGAGGESHG